MKRRTPHRAVSWLALAVAVAGFAAPAGGALANPSVLVDLNSGRVIESEDAFHRWYPASLSKLMTTYVAFRAIRAGEVTLASPVRISKKAAALPPSKMGYKPGSVLTLDTALKIIMVKSANDVAQSIAESIAGTQSGFADRMNAESRRLGMTDSHWVNPHGLHDDAQYTSPRDLVILAGAIRREFPAYADYFSMEGLSADGKEVPSHNNLIGRFNGADGMKTGYTCPAGFNLVASATRGGRTLMAVVLGADSVPARDEKAAAMLERGFAAGVGTGDTLDLMKRFASLPAEPVNMYDTLCSKEARAARAKAAKDLAKAIAAGLQPPQPVPVYLADLPRPRRLVTVGLGGATGPVPKAVAEAVIYADVPIPTWRPDRPAPADRVTEQGDTAAAAK